MAGYVLTWYLGSPRRSALWE